MGVPSQPDKRAKTQKLKEKRRGFETEQRATSTHILAYRRATNDGWLKELNLAHTQPDFGIIATETRQV